MTKQKKATGLRAAKAPVLSEKEADVCALTEVFGSQEEFAAVPQMQMAVADERHALGTI